MCDDCGWSQLIEVIDVALSEAKDVPLRGADFADSVCSKLQSIRGTVDEAEHCSPKQRTAVENMHNGIRKWLGREKGQE